MKKAMINYMKNEKLDNLYTPEYAVKPLMEYILDLKQYNKNTVWECCDSGNSKITKVLKENYFDVINTDIQTGYNFFDYEPDELVRRGAYYYTRRSSFKNKADQ